MFLGKRFFPKTKVLVDLPPWDVFFKEMLMSPRKVVVFHKTVCQGNAFPQYQCVELNFKLCSLRNGITLSFN